MDLRVAIYIKLLIVPVVFPSMLELILKQCSKIRVEIICNWYRNIELWSNSCFKDLNPVNMSLYSSQTSMEKQCVLIFIKCYIQSVCNNIMK